MQSVTLVCEIEFDRLRLIGEEAVGKFAHVDAIRATVVILNICLVVPSYQESVKAAFVGVNILNVNVIADGIIVANVWERPSAYHGMSSGGRLVVAYNGVGNRYNRFVVFLVREN